MYNILTYIYIINETIYLFFVCVYVEICFNRKILQFLTSIKKIFASGNKLVLRNQ